MKNRFANLLLWDLKSHREKLVKALVAISIGLSLANIIQLYSIRNTLYAYSPFISDAFSSSLWSMAGVALYVFGIYIVLSAAHVFKNISGKQERIAFLVLPATNLEKFIERIFYITIVNTILFLLAFLISDVVQYLFSYAITPGFHQFIVISLFSVDAPLDGLLPNNLAMLITFVSFFMWLHSSYVLGGALFRRSPILFTTCLHAIVGIVLTIVLTIIPIGGDLLHPVIFLLALVFDYWAAYWLFTHTQLTTHKWLNL